MKSRNVLAFLLLGLLEASNAYEIKRAVNENCEKLADALEGVIETFDEPTRCMISHFTSSLLDKDLGSREGIEEISCLVLENSASGADIFNALDDAGYIIKMIEVAYSYFAVMGRFASTELLKQGLKFEMNSCNPDHFQINYYAELESEDFYRLYDAMDELQLFSLAPQMTKEVWKLVELAVHFGPSDKSAPLMPGQCSDLIISDPDLRCEKLTAATKPFYHMLFADERAKASLQRLGSQIQLFTGIDLFSNLTEAAHRMDCDIAKATSVGDYRAMLEDYGLLSVGFDLALGFSCVALQQARFQGGALSTLADVWMEVGLGSVELDIPMVPLSMIQSMCRNPPKGPSSFFNFF